MTQEEILKSLEDIFYRMVKSNDLNCIGYANEIGSILRKMKYGAD